MAKNDKRSLIPWGAKVLILKINFCSELVSLETNLLIDHYTRSCEIRNDLNIGTFQV